MVNKGKRTKQVYVFTADTLM